MTRLSRLSDDSATSYISAVLGTGDEGGPDTGLIAGGDDTRSSSVEMACEMSLASV